MSKKNVLKKYFFLLVILVAIALHLLVETLDIARHNKGGILFSMWGVAVCLVMHYWGVNFSNTYVTNCQDFKNQEWDMEGFNKPSEKREYLIKYAKKRTVEAYITKVVKDRLVRPGLTSEYYRIKYEYFDDNGTKNVALKSLYISLFDFSPSNPEVGDKIKIFYDANNPANSTIIYQESSKHRWYQKKKYIINIIKF